MTMEVQRRDYVRPIIVAISLGIAAELFYLVVWGVVLFPQGPFLSKLVWILVCGVAMGSVIAVLTILLVVGRLSGVEAILVSAGIVFSVGSSCALLCSRLDAIMNYFGGAEHARLFILAGVLPAIAGGALYGWLLHSSTGQSLLARLGV